ncbi:MAG: DNRLRE domain-containing protein [Chloroflexi bacterium]|nr:DNRLRE domain-containing protein [Chloroflexota bacterium]
MLVTVKLDERWLKDPQRVYPVYVDPTLDVWGISNQFGDLFVSNAHPMANYGGSAELQTGFNDSTTGKNQAYLKFGLSAISGYSINSAKLKLKKGDILYFNNVPLNEAGRRGSLFKRSVNTRRLSD